ncbi:MAG: flavin reductase (DIM6/NTAB) family NADH-FMN oxidoreductase RutF [Alphaproteobacteria bacterium]|jgi:flavin reductase (DIM6/NTAB) family NADH-FMN oxidoreductase RutF
MMDWAESDMFEPTDHENKPFSIRIPSLLVSRGADGQINFLTAMWYAPAGFNPSRMIVAVGKKTHSHHMILETGEFVMSAPTRAMMDIVVFAGKISGRDVNKWKATGLTPVKPSKGSVPLIGEANGNVEYKLVNSFPLDAGMDIFIGEALCVHMRKGAMDGELYRVDSDPLLYMGTKYENGISQGKHHGLLSGIECADYDSPLLKKYITEK